MEWINSHLLTVIIPLVIGAGLVSLAKIIPAWIEKKAIAALDYLFEKGDAADDEWICATIKWAEAKYGPGTGEIKAKAIVDKIITMLPPQYALFVTEKVKERAMTLFQSCFDRLESTALAEMKEHEGDKK